MNESAADVARLQSLLDLSATKGGPHLRRTFQLPEHAVTAEQLVRYWGDGKSFALAEIVHAKWWRDLDHTRNGAFLTIEADVVYSWAHDPSSFIQS
jgi:hypothetical protein